jgi:hypothetical protein
MTEHPDTPTIAYLYAKAEARREIEELQQKLKDIATLAREWHDSSGYTDAWTRSSGYLKRILAITGETE